MVVVPAIATVAAGTATASWEATAALATAAVATAAARAELLTGVLQCSSSVYVFQADCII